MCEACLYKAIRRYAKKRGLKVSVSYEDNVYVHPASVEIPRFRAYRGAEIEEKYYVAWLKDRYYHTCELFS